MDKYSVRLYDKDGNCTTEGTCFSFRYVKDIYTPYVYFEGKFISSNLELGNYTRIEFRIYSKMMHCGLVDSIDICRKDNRNIITVKSKGFTSLLCQNQPEPQIMQNVTLSDIIATYPDIPYVTCENSEALNYLYIKDGSTIWDSICNFSFRQSGIYPYIESANKVRVTRRPPSRSYTIEPNSILASGVCCDYTRLISHIHMQDIEGNYDTYSQTNQLAVDNSIIRHKQIPLDRQFLYKPEDAPDYKLKFSTRGNNCHYVRYAGFNYEDIFDLVTYDGFSQMIVHGVELIFNGTTPVTTVKIYDDGFFQPKI